MPQLDLWTVNLTILGADGQPYDVASVLANEHDAVAYVNLAKLLPAVRKIQCGPLASGQFARA